MNNIASDMALLKIDAAIWSVSSVGQKMRGRVPTSMAADRSVIVGASFRSPEPGAARNQSQRQKKKLAPMNVASARWTVIAFDDEPLKPAQIPRANPIAPHINTGPNIFFKTAPPAVIFTGVRSFYFADCAASVARRAVSCSGSGTFASAATTSAAFGPTAGMARR
jgi:hypothetical protein